jgi:hypothetical protein
MRTLLKSSILAAVAMTIFGSLSTAHARPDGGANGGGGNLCYRDGKPVLLEFANVGRRQIQAGIQYPKSFDDRELSYAGKQMVQSELNQRRIFGYSRFKWYMQDGKLQERITEVLNRNKPLSPLLVGLLRQQFMFIHMVKYPINVAFHASYDGIPECSDSNVRASAIYSQGLNVWIDLEQFNSLDLDSQAGLFLHEELRILQALARSFTPSVDLSDRELQDIVRTLFYGPKPLDQTPAIQAIFQNWPGTLKYKEREWAFTPCGRFSGTNSSTELKALVGQYCALYLEPQGKSQLLSKLKTLEPMFKRAYGSTHDLAIGSFLSEIEYWIKNWDRLGRGLEDLIQDDSFTRLNLFQNILWGKDVKNSFVEPEMSWNYLSDYEIYRNTWFPSESVRNQWERDDAELCNVRENIREFMATANTALVATSKGLSLRHPKCSQ